MIDLWLKAVCVETINYSIPLLDNNSMKLLPYQDLPSTLAKLPPRQSTVDNKPTTSFSCT